MSLFSTAPFSNITVYRKEFYKKTSIRTPLGYPIPDYPNPISGPFEEHVLPNFRYRELPVSQTKYPNPKEYAVQVAENYPSTRIYLRDPPGRLPDLNAIDKLYEDENRTIYMISYCERGDFDSKTKSKKIRTPLPEGWVVPLTTHKCSYRHPAKVPQKLKLSRKKDNLTPNLKEREILETKTGDTTYMSEISDLGMEIIKGKLHGDVDIRPTFNQDDLLKARLIRRH